MSTLTSTSELKVKVSKITQVAPAIKEFVFEPEDSILPAFSAGSHVVVTMKGEEGGKAKTWRNPYSLLSDSYDESAYRIAVRLQDESRGGSVFMHESVKEGDVLTIKPPANLFAPYWRAKKHVLFAGGVGVTPFMSYIPEMLRRDANLEMHYMFHSNVTGAYQSELRNMLGDKLHCYDSDESVRCKIYPVMAAQPIGTHVYICGPESLILAVQSAAEELGWPASAIHFEVFSAPAPGKPFIAELKRSGKLLEIAHDESLLDALEAAEVDIQSSCRGGVCGRCITPLLEGQADHRDQFLSDDEKTRQDCVMPCVSRAKHDKLVLDL